MRALAVFLFVAFSVCCSPPAEGLPDAAGSLCTSDAECDDGYFCNGAERCDVGGFRTDIHGCLRGTPPCADACDETSGCLTCGVADGDLDAHRSFGCGGRDCDDTDATVHPDAPERCDGVDQDCDGRVDEELTAVFLDRDGDGHGEAELPACDLALPTAATGGDCDDTNSHVHPAATEICDGVDDDCDGSIDGTDARCAIGAETTCLDGRCVWTECLDGREDCNGVAGDGCEVDLTADPRHCGGCTNACDVGDTCVAGECNVTACPAGEHPCGDVCRSDHDAETCGTSCTPCPTVANGRSWCNGWECLVRCDDGYVIRGDADETRRCEWISADLADLRLSVGIVTPPFRPDVSLYSVEVTAETASIDVTPIAPPRAELAVTLADGSIVPLGEPSAAITLTPGLNVVDVTSTSAIGQIRAYRVYVQRGPWPTFERMLRGEPGERLCAGLAMDGDTLLIGAPAESGVRGGTEGVVHVLTREVTGWSEVAVLAQPPELDVATFGDFLAIDGDVLAVASPYDSVDGLEYAGSVSLFHRDGTTWTLDTVLHDPRPSERAFFGRALAVDGDRIFIGVPGDDAGTTSDDLDTVSTDSGAVRVARRVGETWVFEAFLKETTIGEVSVFGDHIAADGGVAMVASRRSLHVLDRASGTWVARMTYAGYPGDGLVSSGSWLLASRANAPAAPSPDAGPDAYGAGDVRVLQRLGTTLVERESLTAPNADRNDYFGNSISIRGDSAAVIASNEASFGGLPWDDAGGGGAAYLFSDIGSAPRAVSYVSSARVVTSSPTARIRLERVALGDREMIVCGDEVGEGHRGVVLRHTLDGP